MGALESYVQTCGLEASLIDLVKTRASQINGCAFCIHMHSREARARGETEERLYLLDASREAAKRDLFAYIEAYYNRQRLHSALGYLTPEQAELQAA